MNYEPLVSIVIPVYNGYPFLKEAIDSCISQTYKNIEIIVVNDGSPDDGETEMIAKSYKDKVRYYYKENGGVSTALNYGISKMRGEWFSWLSHDDLYKPDKIKKQIEAVSKLNNKVCVVRCSVSSINETGEEIFRPQRHIKGYHSADRMMKLHALKEVSLYGCSLLIHKNILDDCGEFNVQLKAQQDEEYWNRIIVKGYPFLSISDELVHIRVHNQQMSKLISHRFDIEMEMRVDYIIDNYKKDPTRLIKIIEYFTYQQAKEHNKLFVKKLKSVIDDVSGKKYIRDIVICKYSLYGIMYSAIKKLYRKLIIARHRNK